LTAGTKVTYGEPSRRRRAMGSYDGGGLSGGVVGAGEEGAVDGLRRRRETTKRIASTAATTTTAMTIHSELIPEGLLDLLTAVTFKVVDAWAVAPCASVTTTTTEKLPVAFGVQLNPEEF
jgi:hypothetical protein